MGKNLGNGKLLLQVLRGFGLVGCEGRDVDQGGDSAVRPGMGDQGATVRVADKDHEATDPPEAAVGSGRDAGVRCFEQFLDALSPSEFETFRGWWGKLSRGDQDAILAGVSR